MHAAKRRKRLAGPEPDREPERIPPGEYIGFLDWHGAGGSVRRLVIRQGTRANQIQVDGMAHSIGWDRLLRHIRARLATTKRRFHE